MVERGEDEDEALAELGEEVVGLDVEVDAAPVDAVEAEAKILGQKVLLNDWISIRGWVSWW